LALCVALMGCATERPYEETIGKRGWTIFLHPAKKNPTDEMAYAQQLLREGKKKAALKEFKALSIFWIGAPEAAPAQYQYAKLLEERGNLFKAFDEYQYLIEHYTGQFPFDEVLERQFNIAVHLMNTKKGKFFLFPGFSAPERAVPMFEKIVANGPEWARAPEAQYLIGRAYELSGQYELAVVAYMAAEYRYPNSAFTEKAAFGKTQCLYLLAQESPNDDQARDEAWAAITLFQNTYPNSVENGKIQEYRKTIFRQRAKAAYDLAYYYDRIAKKPKAALIAYDNLAKLFPDSDWAGLAQARIVTLKKTVETSNDKANP
jgi:tetratricopeptide (TPR) repeat protein